MSPEAVFKYYRAYKLCFSGNFDFRKYRGNIRTPPLIKQPDRRFYHRIAQKLQDPQIHALFAHGFFFNPRAWIADFATAEAFSSALVFASRAENGQTLFEHDLYALAKRLETQDLDAWLYGEIIGNERSAIPGCVQDIITRELPADLACAVLLIPQPARQFHWVRYWVPTDFGASVWVDRLRKLDSLLYMQRTGWRTMTHEVVKDFWNTVGQKSLAPHALKTPEPVLF